MVYPYRLRCCIKCLNNGKMDADGVTVYRNKIMRSVDICIWIFVRLLNLSYEQ